MRVISFPLGNYQGICNCIDIFLGVFSQLLEVITNSEEENLALIKVSLFPRISFHVLFHNICLLREIEKY